MGKYEQMLDNLVALLQIVEEFQTEYGMYFQIWGEQSSEAIEAFNFENGVIASVERR